MADGQITNQERNFVTRIITDASNLLAIKETLERDIALYNQKQYLVKLDDALLSESFDGLTAQELVDGITAIQTVLTALGDYQSGQAVNLIKLAVGRS